MGRSSANSPYGPRPTDAEVREARAAGLPNPRWARQNKIAHDRIRKTIEESELYAREQANYDAAINFQPAIEDKDKDNV